MSTNFSAFVNAATDPGVPAATSQVVYCTGGTATHRATPLEMFAGGFPQDISLTNPTTGNSTQANALSLTVVTDSTTTDPGFCNQYMLRLYFEPTNGLNWQEQSGKTFFSNLSLEQDARACGQRFLERRNFNAYGMGDAFEVYSQSTFAGGVDADGDEGQGCLDLNAYQASTLAKSTITAVSTSSVNTTLSQDITASKTAQTVNVGSTTGLNVGDWVTIPPQAPNVSFSKSGFPNTTCMECVKITALTATSITAVFYHNHYTGDAVKPATKITVNNAFGFGQHRWVVNLSATAYSTGTASCSGSTVTGSGTAWTTGVVGDTTSGGTSIGMISFAADDNTSSPFGAGTSRLRDWYPITAVASNTSLSILMVNISGFRNYAGLATSLGSYEIRPGCRIMNFDGTSPTTNSFVVPYNTFTWTVGDTLECTISPDLQMAALRLRGYVYGNGVTGSSLVELHSFGTKAIDNGIWFDPSGAGYKTGIDLEGCATGIVVGSVTTQAIRLNNSSPTHIVWGTVTNPGIYLNQSTRKIEVALAGASSVGSTEPGKINLGTSPGGSLQNVVIGGVLTIDTTNGNGTVAPSLTFLDANNNHKLTITGASPPSFSADRTLTLQDASGTLPVLAYRASVGASNLQVSDDVVTYDASGGSLSPQLPNASTVPAGKRITVKKIDSSANTVTVQRNGTPGTDTVDGAANFVLGAQWKYVTLVSDGSSKWFVVANN